MGAKSQVQFDTPDKVPGPDIGNSYADRSNPIFNVMKMREDRVQIELVKRLLGTSRSCIRTHCSAVRARVLATTQASKKPGRHGQEPKLGTGQPTTSVRRVAETVDGRPGTHPSRR